MLAQRCIEVRLAEGVKLLFESDDEFNAEFPGGCHVGPFTPTVIGDGDATVKARQVNILIPPNSRRFQGVGGFANVIKGLVVVIYDSPDNRPYDMGSVTPVCRMRYLQHLINAGSDDNGKGKIVDPDAEITTPFNPLHYLNNDAPEFTDTLMGTLLDENVARVYAFLAQFRTRETARTGVRS
jgi:hypothetical protein